MDSTEVIYLPTASGPMPVATQINGRLYAIDADHLNTPRRLTNTQGQVAWQWLISGFGEVQPTTGANGYALNGIPSSKVYSEPVTFKLRYPGQVWDEETGLAYNLHRYYDAQVGRYVQADPIGLEGGWNRFGYVGGDPLGRIDPMGLDWYRHPDSTPDSIVGRRDHPIVPPGGPISRFIERFCPAGRTFGEMHVARYDDLLSRSVPEWRANFLTMPGAYLDAVKHETGRSLQNLDGAIKNLYRR